MKYYKKLLLKKLIDTGWELVEKDEEPSFWWLESSWKLRSIKQSFGDEIFVLFLVDPLYDGQNKSESVWAVSAYTEIPQDRPLEDGISTMSMVKGKFDEKLSQFVGEVNEYRNQVHS